MVKGSRSPLDRTFAALSDPTRRALVMRLAQQPDLSVSELAAPFDVRRARKNRAHRRLPSRRQTDARCVRVA
jgi:DNA-binding transcriptional ArsR family regulator